MFIRQIPMLQCSLWLSMEQASGLKTMQLIDIGSIYWILWVKLMHIGLKDEESLTDELCLIETDFGFLFPCFTLYLVFNTFSRVRQKWAQKLINFPYTHHILCSQGNKYIKSKIAENEACGYHQCNLSYMISVMLMLRTNGLLCMYHCGFDDGRLFFLIKRYFINGDIWQQNNSTKHSHVCKVDMNAWKGILVV